MVYRHYLHSHSEWICLFVPHSGVRPKDIHTDRGTQYTSVLYMDETYGISKSYSAKANPWDNACIEIIPCSN